MSQAVLLLATKDFILRNITFNNSEITENLCDVMTDGRPAPIAGEFFMSIHSGSIRNESMEILNCLMGINVTLTYRIARVEEDRRGVEIVAKLDFGIEDMVWKIIRAIHNNQELINNANSLITREVNKFVEPLRFNVSSPPRIVGADWFHANKGVESGLIRTISFDNARLTTFADYQSIPELVGDGVTPYYGPTISPNASYWGGNS